MITRTEPSFNIRHIISRYANKCDYCDLRFGMTEMKSASLSNDQVTQLSAQRNYGFFARAKICDKWGEYFASSMNPHVGDRALRLAIDFARGKMKESTSKMNYFVHSCDLPDSTDDLMVSLKDSIEPLLEQGLDWEVQYSQLHINEEIGTKDGHQSCYRQSHVLIMIKLTTCGPRGPISVNGQIAKRDQECWYPKELSSIGKDLLARIEKVKLGDEAPRGSFPIILDSSLGAILVHEIFGHGLEADLVLEGRSPFSVEVSKRVTGHDITVVDCGNVSWGFARYDFDQEGTEASQTILIENGTLESLIHSKKTASESSCLPTGNGRAGSISEPPIPRASNIQVLPGTASLKKILSNMGTGVYAEGALGEAIFIPERGIYWIEAESGYLIEGGAITRPLSSMAITGNAEELLWNMIAVKGDFSTFPGFCLKRQQYVPVDTRCPPLYIGRATIVPTG